MHWAASRGVLNIINKLMNKKGDPGGINNHGCQPIHKAAIYGNTVIIKKFIEAGVPADVVDKEGHGARVLEVDQDLGAVNVACETHHHLGIQGHKLHAEAYQRRVQLETKEAILAL